MTNDNIKFLAFAFLIWLPAALSLSYLAALINEPRAYWLWHDILGILP